MACEEGKRAFTSDDASQYNEKVKLGMTFNPKELIVMPPSWCRGFGEVVCEVKNEHGWYVSFLFRFDMEMTAIEKYTLMV